MSIMKQKAQIMSRLIAILSIAALEIVSCPVTPFAQATERTTITSATRDRALGVLLPAGEPSFADVSVLYVVRIRILPVDGQIMQLEFTKYRGARATGRMWRLDCNAFEFDARLAKHIDAERPVTAEALMSAFTITEVRVSNDAALRATLSALERLQIPVRLDTGDSLDGDRVEIWQYTVSNSAYFSLNGSGHASDKDNVRLVRWAYKARDIVGR